MMVSLGVSVASRDSKFVAYCDIVMGRWCKISTRQLSKIYHRRQKLTEETR